MFFRQFHKGEQHLNSCLLQLMSKSFRKGVYYEWSKFLPQRLDPVENFQGSKRKDRATSVEGVPIHFK